MAKQLPLLGQQLKARQQEGAVMTQAKKLAGLSCVRNASMLGSS